MGWAATRAHLLTSGALDALNVFSFRFALPALVLRLIAAQPLRQTFNPRFYAGYLASGVIVFVLVLLNVFSFRFALPALVLRLIAAQPLRQTFNPRFYAGYLASGVIV
ncbi:hypothetical protein ACRXB1_36875, partial [Caballeronia sp. M23-90]